MILNTSATDFIYLTFLQRIEKQETRNWKENHFLFA